MKSKIILFLFFFFYLAEVYSGRVVKISGYSPSSTSVKPVEESPSELDTPEKIESALNDVKKNDIKTYKSFQKLRENNFPDFVVKLTQWNMDNNQGLIDKKFYNLTNEKQDLSAKLAKCSYLFKQEKSKPEEDKNAKLMKETAENINKYIERLFEIDLEQYEIQLLKKRKEVAYYETMLEKKKQSKEEFIKSNLKTQNILKEDLIK